MPAAVEVTVFLRSLVAERVTVLAVEPETVAGFQPLPLPLVFSSPQASAPVVTVSASDGTQTSHAVPFCSFDTATLTSNPLAPVLLKLRMILPPLAALALVMVGPCQ